MSTQAKTATVVRSALQSYTNTHVCLASSNPIRHHACSTALATSTRACNKNTESRHDYDTTTLSTIPNYDFKHNSALVRSAGLSTRTQCPRGRTAASHRSCSWSLTPPSALARWGYGVGGPNHWLGQQLAHQILSGWHECRCVHPADRLSRPKLEAPFRPHRTASAQPREKACEPEELQA